MLKVSNKKLQNDAGQCCFRELAQKHATRATCHTETTTDVCLMFKVGCSWGIFSFK